MYGESVSGGRYIHVFMCVYTEGWVCLMSLSVCVCVGGGEGTLSLCMTVHLSRVCCVT